MQPVLLALSFLIGIVAATGAADVSEAHRLSLTLRRRVKQSDGGFRVREDTVTWDARKTALILCDMWDQHWCKSATRRVAEMAPRMNRFVQAAREKGVLIIHAPSACMASYHDHPARRRAQQAPRAANLPERIDRGGTPLPAEETLRWPLDQSDGGCDCQPQCAQGHPWRRQIATIEIHDRDAISDSGSEIWNLLEHRGVGNVLLVGVHTNMCVIGRPFGLRNLVRYGKTVALVRDLTDTMYNPRRWPHVSHFRGTDLVVEHIEKAVCPTLTSNQLLGGLPFRFKGDERPHVVLVIGESHHYGSEKLLGALARELEAEHAMVCTVLQATGPHDILGLDALGTADLAVFFIRRRVLPREQMKHVRDYLEAGKPLVAFRTSSHAFAPRGGKLPEGVDRWDRFDREVLGCHYQGHGRGDTEVRLVPEAKDHPILRGIGDGPHRVGETLYRSLPLAPACTVLLRGKSLGTPMPDQPVAWTHRYKGGRIFYTALGHHTTFDQPWFHRLVLNGVYWALGKPIPQE